MSTYRVSKIRSGSGPPGNNTVLRGNNGRAWTLLERRELRSGTCRRTDYRMRASAASSLPCRPPKPPLLMIST